MNNIVAHGDSYFISPYTYFAENSALTVGRNCFIKGNVTSMYATLRIGGQFTPEGSFVYYSHELDARIAAENERIKAIIKKAKRQQKKKICKKIISMAISSLITSGLSPILFSGFGKMGMAIAKSTLFGGLNAAIGGGKPLKSALQAGLISGFGQGIGGILQVAVKSDLLREALMTASTSGLQAALHGRIVPKDILFSMGTNALSNFLIPSHLHSNPVHGAQEIIQGISESAVRALVSSSMSSLINHTNFSKTLLFSAIEGSVQTLADGLGRNLAERLMEYELFVKKHESEKIGSASNNVFRTTPSSTQANTAALRVDTKVDQLIEAKTKMDNTRHQNVNRQSVSTERNGMRNTPQSTQQTPGNSRKLNEPRPVKDPIKPQNQIGKGSASHTPYSTVVVNAPRRDPMSTAGDCLRAGKNDLGKAAASSATSSNNNKIGTHKLDKRNDGLMAFNDKKQNAERGSAKHKNYYIPQALSKRESDEAADSFLQRDKRQESHYVPDSALQQYTKESADQFMPRNIGYAQPSVGYSGSSGSQQNASNTALQNVVARLPLKALCFEQSPADVLNGTGWRWDERIPQKRNNNMRVSDLEESINPKSIQRQSLGYLGKHALQGMNDLRTCFNEFSQAYPTEVDVTTRFLDCLSNFPSLLVEEAVAKWSDKHLQTYQNNSADLADGFKYILNYAKEFCVKKYDEYGLNREERAGANGLFILAAYTAYTKVPNCDASRINPKPKVKIPVRDREVFGGPKNPPVKDRIYMPQDQQFKHHPNGHGSTNPIRDNKVLQELLDTAYSVPDTKQVYNIHNRKLIKFESNGMKGYHAYEVSPRNRIPILKQIPEVILDKMASDGLLTNHEVRLLIKNKGII